LKAKDRGIHV